MHGATKPQSEYKYVIGAGSGRIIDTIDSEETIDQAAVDALDVLPLGIMPLQTRSLRQARLVKTMRLESVVELYGGRNSGAGLIDIDRLGGLFSWEDARKHPDLELIRQVASLPSYDVYSLRIALRNLGIAPTSSSYLHLSEAKKRELQAYMRSFTRPLMQQVFGGGAAAHLQDFNQLLGLFRQDDKSEALRNLRLMAERLRIGLGEVPRFVENYGDTFLSLAYFRQELDGLVPQIRHFLDDLQTLKKLQRFAQDITFQRAAGEIEETLRRVIRSLVGRFNAFEIYSRTMWSDINQDSFRRLSELISDHHSSVGGVICGLTVKMRGWDKAFGGVSARRGTIGQGEFVLTDFLPGLAEIERIEREAPHVDDVEHLVKSAARPRG
jgi:hypothetical protein